MDNLKKTNLTQNVDCSLSAPDGDGGGHLLPGPRLHLPLPRHLGLPGPDHMLRLLQLSDIRAGPAQAVQRHSGGALVPGEWPVATQLF